MLIIPSPPGFQTIAFCLEDHEDDPFRQRDIGTFDVASALTRHTIIAWKILDKGPPEPVVTWEDVEAESQGFGTLGDFTAALLDPAGTVVVPGLWTWRSTQEWIERFVRTEWRSFRESHPLPPAPRPTGGRTLKAVT